MNATEVSLRDYFAAHAPPEPQPWFSPTMAAEQPKSPSYTMPKGFEHLQTMANHWRKDPVWELGGREEHSVEECNALEYYFTQWTRYWMERDGWHCEQGRQRLIQWPFAWADEMMRQRPRS
jgi:hypothetical protein